MLQSYQDLDAVHIWYSYYISLPHANASIIEIRDDKLVKDDSDSVQDTFFKVLFAQKEREDISRRTKAGLARRVAEA